MKSLVTVLLLLLAVGTSLAQDVTHTPALTQQDYLKLSQTQKTGAWLLMIAGVGTLVVTTGKHLGNSISNTQPTFPIIPFVLGAGSIGGSIALFKASARNKQRALETAAYFNFQPAPTVPHTATGPTYMPGLSVKLTLK